MRTNIKITIIVTAIDIIMDEAMDKDEVPLDVAEEEEAQDFHQMKKALKTKNGKEVSQEKDKCMIKEMLNALLTTNMVIIL